MAPQGFSADPTPSAQDVIRLIDRIQERGIRAVFVENVVDARLLRRLADETGAGAGGALCPGRTVRHRPTTT